MGETLRLTDGEVRLIRLAALLHDVGHGPFSHVSESSLARYADRRTLSPDQSQHKIHEVITAQIISSDPEIGVVIPAPDRRAAIDLLGHGYGRPVLKQLVSGPLDADKQDYLLRDSHFCGVRYGVYDLHQLQRSLLLVPTGGSDDELMVHPDGVHAVEQFFLAKYYMTANVYRHRVRLITDQMIGRAIRLGVDVDRLELMDRLYRFDNSPEFVANYRLWDDARFMETFCPSHTAPPGAKSGELLLRLRRRDLLKRVFSFQTGELDGRVRDVVSGLPKPAYDSIRDRIELQVSDYLSRQLGTVIDPAYVIIHAYDAKSVRETSRNEESEILVNNGPSPTTFPDASTLFRSINEAVADKRVEVYAPITWPDSAAKRDLPGRWRADIRGVIEQECLTHRSGGKR